MNQRYLQGVETIEIIILYTLEGSFSHFLPVTRGGLMGVAMLEEKWKNPDFLGIYVDKMRDS